MKKIVLVLAIACVGLISCNNTSNTPAKLEVKLDTAKSLSEAIMQKPFSNPALIYGSSFGSYFQALYKLGHYNEMIKFTSGKIIEKYGKDKLIKMYSKLDFAYPLQLKNMSKDTETGNIQLTYMTTIIATVKIFRMDVRIENDSVKFMSCDLSGFPNNTY